MKKHNINTELIHNWESFHDLFSNQFNFPHYYGRNMDTWIDCMEDYAIEGLTILEFGNCEKLKNDNPEIHEAILEASAFINYRCSESGGTPELIISMG
jgi:RNAse (barnase) inhibitor barstar